MLPLPSWNGAHPIAVHFPIALLATAPLLVAACIALKDHRTFHISALVVMFLGTTGAWLAVATGGAAAELVPGHAGIAPLLERHEEMAERTRTVFTILTLVWGSLLAVPWALRRELSAKARLGAGTGFLAAYALGLFCLVCTADQGGRLVHDLGVRADVASEAPRVGPRPVGLATPRSDHSHGD